MKSPAVALLAPGQGSRDLVALIEFARRSSSGRELLECAADAAATTIQKCIDQGGRALERTEVLQPVLTAISLFADGEVRERGVVPHFVAGHSLGELAAWAMAGCVGREDAIKVAAIRGRLMARESLRHPGGMLALVDKPDPERALAIGRACGWVEIAAENAPDEIVLAGSDEALRAIAASMPARRLSVAGAWHSSAMNDAVDEFREALSSVEQSSIRYPWVLNADGQFVSRADDIPRRLAEQLVRPNRWMKTMQTLHSAGARYFITMGPGAIVRNLVRKNLGQEVGVFGTESVADLHRTAEELGSK